MGCGVSSTEAQAEKTGRQSSAVLGGQRDTTHGNVVAIFIAKDELFPDGTVCTGALIAPNLVLTARHCVSTLDNHDGAYLCEDTASAKAQRPSAPVPAADVSVVFDTEAYDANNARNKPVSVAEVIIEPGSTGAINCGRDVALLRLAKASTVSPIVPRIKEAPVVGETFTSVGYGLDGTTGYGMRRWRSGLKVVGVGLSRDDIGRVEALESEWLADKGPCDGDSGGPALDANGKLLGVVSRGMEGCINHVLERLDSRAAWLKESARAAATQLGQAPVAWAADETAPSQDGSAENDAGAATPSSDTPAAPAPTGCAVAHPSESGAASCVFVALGLAVARGRRRTRVRSCA
jgi:secreted trypsin-like serine protease